MTNEQKLEMFKMRLNKCTYQEIGDHFGISRQGAQQALEKVINPRKQNSRCKNIYPNIEKYMKENELSVDDLASKLGMSTTTIYSRISGETEFKSDEMLKILEFSNSDFKTFFKKEDL